MSEKSPIDNGHIAGFEVPIHGSLGSPILMGGAPRGLAIVNGTCAAAIGLGLQQWIPGIIVWAVGHSIAVFAARRDPAFASVLIRHLRQRSYLTC
ncbi:VirB3 family type IV secretion system protein [Sphingobium subterraneum]|uniref:Type IV secretion system protein VirB3 n=1 Tax=Sphingobium subterraneum TaxID=627688 RepID=A0A841J9Z0_9SPHN|nr:VirB3 family type IV secretion system protein [Sphingobium subterraneum]MBB6125388.1 type IV secretion system protein VirB3 [Sphingobium subterraneum]